MGYTQELYRALQQFKYLQLTLQKKLSWQNLDPGSAVCLKALCCIWFGWKILYKQSDKKTIK